MAEGLRQRWREIERYQVRRHWDSHTSNAIVHHVLVYPEFREVLGVSDEQYRQIGDKMHQASLEMLEETRKKIQAIHERAGVPMHTQFGPSLPNAGVPNAGVPKAGAFSAEDLKEFQNIAERTKWTNEIIFSDLIGGELTPEQHQKINEALLANIGLAMMSPISPSRFEGLNLTDAQREQMRIFEKEIEPKLEIFINNYIDSRIARDNRLHSIITEQKGKALREKTQEANKIIIDDAEFNRHFAAMVSHRREFSTLVLKEIGERNILTDAQWARLQELCDNPPEHAKILRRAYSGGGQDGESGRNNARGGTSESGGGESAEIKDGDKSDVWQPGPDSWKPGDAIPEQYRQQRQERGRFPGAE